MSSLARAVAGNPPHFPLMLELLITNPHVHLALANAASVAAAFFWGYGMGHRKGMHDERVRFLSFLFSEKMEELTQTKTENQEQHG